MTVITDRVEDVGGGPLLTPVMFTVQQVRESADGDSIVVPLRHRVQPVDGVITTPELDPGPATVTLGGSRQATYNILVPDSSTPIRLWPLIDAGMPSPPEDDRYQFVRNGGGLARGVALTQAEMDAQPFDPGSFYLITDSFIGE
ncbi:hypothetical protein [Gordonia sp. (in: high G+C Gram-positive bacteria)]|uniref:hypothetical protein n=1 Tax=Gordonia sp. (in: high G+C Gram-positive bacteria) TaxID=84139 RepID=UPI003F945450